MKNKTTPKRNNITRNLVIILLLAGTGTLVYLNLRSREKETATVTPAPVTMPAGNTGNNFNTPLATSQPVATTTDTQSQRPPAKYDVSKISNEPAPPTPAQEFNRIFLAAMDDFNNKLYEKAISGFQAAYKIDPQYYCLEDIGVCYYYQNNYAEAEKWFNLAVKTGKAPDGKSEYFRALSLLQLSRLSEACDQLRAAEKKNFPDAARSIGLYCK